MSDPKPPHQQQSSGFLPAGLNKDLESGQHRNPDAPLPGHPSLHRSPSRSTLPGSVHQAAYTTDPDAPPLPTTTMTAPSSTIDGGGAQNDDEEEYPWGPSHPCFPHLNPHVPLTSPLHQSTRVIRIRRDWMARGDLAPTFANLYPEVLDPLISEDEFRRVLRHVNAEVEAAFDPWSMRNWVDVALGVLTLWMWDDFGFARVKGRLAALEEWLDVWNEEVGRKEGVRIAPLRRTGYLSLDFQIPDPHISLDTAQLPPTRPETVYSGGADQRTHDMSYPVQAITGAA